MTFEYIVHVYRKDTDELFMEAVYTEDWMLEYEDVCSILDTATAYYYDVEVQQTIG